MVLADSSPCVEAERKGRAGDRRHHQQDQGQLRHFILETIQAFRTGNCFILSGFALGANKFKTFPTYSSFQERKECIVESILSLFEQDNVEGCLKSADKVLQCLCVAYVPYLPQKKVNENLTKITANVK